MSLEQDILQQVASASDEAALEALRVATLGKKGSISEQMKTLGAMGPEERKTAGAALNVLKDKVTEAIAARKAVLQEAQLEQRLASEKIDVTLPSRAEPRGTVHERMAEADVAAPVGRVAQVAEEQRLGQPPPLDR